MRKIMIVSLFALVIPLRAASSPIGAVIVSWDIDSTKNTVTLHMVNNTTKDITFLNVSIKEIYGLAVNDHQFSQEMPDVSFLMNDPTYPPHEDLRRYHHGGNGTWQAGTPRDVKIGVSPGLTHFEAVLDTVTYSDNTAETTNPDALQRELDGIKAAAQTLQATNDAIRKALANTADASPHETAAKQIEGLEKSWQTAGHHSNFSFSPGASGRIVSDLREAPAAAKELKETLPEYLNNMLARNEKLASLYLGQSAPKVGGVK